ncbi:MAG: adenylosuccinate lyase [Nitrospirae bacterium GWC2_57_13]|jgi:adenylosuccinate lyase|nr:MAG: adenylosuccinate lyase [Nitrospirae bacterium GWC1_57_7]OGW28667.1 MAG: adenylosuccinate lyase [Nitrospirae bacterium GWC2_57_13]OGW44017.1 MAG: adenylosuccinate lyase [Nitrospirae bacterium GWD2_57_8]
MISRYSRPEMAVLWDPENRYRAWLEVELLACEANAKLGLIPVKALANIKKKAAFSLDRIEAIEKQVKHDVIAFLTAVNENVGPDSRFIHLGLTSSDVLDTSLAWLMRRASDIIIADLKLLLKTLKRKALRYRKTVMIGRSHGIHAEPVTFGLKMAVWYEEVRRSLERMERAKDVISVGKVSGAVGTFANIHPSVERHVCRKLGLRPEPAATQIVQRDRHAEYLSTLALIASSIEKFSVELRHLQRTEVLEAEEFFSEGQKGSSAMPHKRNPISAENLTGLARVVRANSLAAMENVALWHERDISHSSVERIIIPDSTILIDYMLGRFTSLVDKLIVYPRNMERNMAISKGLFHSETVMLALVEKGAIREDAYRYVQRNAMEVWKRGGDFRERLKRDDDINRLLKGSEIDSCFDLSHTLKRVDYIYRRVFGSSKA